MLASALEGQSGVSARQTSQELSDPCAHLSVPSTIRSLLSTRIAFGGVLPQEVVSLNI